MNWKLIFQIGLVVFWGLKLWGTIINAYNKQKVKYDLPNTLIFIMGVTIISMVYIVATVIFGLVGYGVINLLGIV